MALCLGLPRWAGTRKVKPIWILLKQELVSGSGINWAICVCTSLQTDNHASAPPLSFFTGRMPFLPPNQQRQSTEGSVMLKYYLNAIVILTVVIEATCFMIGYMLCVFCSFPQYCKW